LEHTFQIPAAEHLFMEPECSIARPTSDGQMEIYVGSQIPYSDRQQVARALGWPENRVRIIGQFVGVASVARRISPGRSMLLSWLKLRAGR